MYLSIIIPTFNRSKLLKDTILSFLEQSLPFDDFEILVIDNNSVDNTKKVVEYLNKEYNNKIKYFLETKPGLLAGRHRGYFESRGDILVYADDDIIADKDYLKNIFYSFKDDSDIALLTGKVLPKFDNLNMPAWVSSFWVELDEGKYLDFLSLVDLGDKYKEISCYFVFGCSFIIKRNLIKKYGGFHPDVVASQPKQYWGDGETGLAKEIEKAGLKIIYNPALKIKHLVTKERLSLKYFRTRAYMAGMSESYGCIRRDKKIIYKFFLLRVLTFLKFFLLFLKGGTNKIKYEVKMYYVFGFVRHQLLVFKSKKILNFVLKDNYFDQ